MSETQTRANVKQALEAARLEIDKALQRVDTASGNDLVELRAGARNLAAFVDFNSSCGAAAIGPNELLNRLRGP